MAALVRGRACAARIGAGGGGEGHSVSFGIVGMEVRIATGGAETESVATSFLSFSIDVHRRSKAVVVCPDMSFAPGMLISGRILPEYFFLLRVFFRARPFLTGGGVASFEGGRIMARSS